MREPTNDAIHLVVFQYEFVLFGGGGVGGWGGSGGWLTPGKFQGYFWFFFQELFLEGYGDQTGCRKSNLGLQSAVQRHSKLYFPVPRKL